MTTIDEWLPTAVTEASGGRDAAERVFAQAALRVGRDPVDPGDTGGLVHGTVADRARAALLAELAVTASGPELADLADALYRRGDAEQRRGVLRGLDLLAPALPEEVRVAALELIRDALRANDPRLVAAGMGDAGAALLPDHEWRHGVVKLVFMGVPLAAASGLDDRRDAELARMARDLIAERTAAGRDISDDLAAIAVAPETDREHL